MSSKTGGANSNDQNEGLYVMPERQVRQDHLPQEVTALRRREQSLQKMVIGMATGRYRFDRRAVRNKATREIADDLLRAGVPLDEETILTHLRQATELLPTED